MPPTKPYRKPPADKKRICIWGRLHKNRPVEFDHAYGHKDADQRMSRLLKTYLPEDGWTLWKGKASDDPALQKKAS